MVIHLKNILIYLFGNTVDLGWGTRLRSALLCSFRERNFRKRGLFQTLEWPIIQPRPTQGPGLRPYHKIIIIIIIIKNLPLRKQAQAPPPLSNAQNFIKLYIFLIVLHFFLNDTKDITNFTRLTNWHVTDHKRSNLNICKLDWWNSSIIVFVTSYCEHFVVIFFFSAFFLFISINTPKVQTNRNLTQLKA